MRRSGTERRGNSECMAGVGGGSGEEPPSWSVSSEGSGPARPPAVWKNAPVCGRGLDAGWCAARCSSGAGLPHGEKIVEKRLRNGSRTMLSSPDTNGFSHSTLFPARARIDNHHHILGSVPAAHVLRLSPAAHRRGGGGGGRAEGRAEAEEQGRQQRHGETGHMAEQRQGAGRGRTFCFKDANRRKDALMNDRVASPRVSNSRCGLLEAVIATAVPRHKVVKDDERR